MRKTTERKNKYDFTTEEKGFVKASNLFDGKTYTVQGIYKNTKGFYGEHWVAVLEGVQLSLSSTLNDTMESLDNDEGWIESVKNGTASVVIKKMQNKKYGEYFLPVFEYFTKGGANE